MTLLDSYERPTHVEEQLDIAGGAAAVTESQFAELSLVVSIGHVIRDLHTDRLLHLVYLQVRNSF